MFGIILKRDYIVDILNGKKKYIAMTIATNIRGKIALVEEKTDIIFGYANLFSVHKISYEEYINWKVCQSFSKYDAKKHLENNNTLENKVIYAYDLMDIESIENPKKIEVINKRGSWLEFNDEYSNIRYVKQSLFDLE